MSSTRVNALVVLGRALRDAGYRFVTVTPETHRRVVARSAPTSPSLRDVFGWGRSFAPDALPAPLFDLLVRAEALVPSDRVYRSAVRFSSLGEDLFVHSAHPTLDPDAVFFGPDTYRFCAAVARANGSARRVVDVGCGSGAAGLAARDRCERVVLADVNDEALMFAEVNCALAGACGVEIVRSDVLAGVTGAIDRVIANPPYLCDDRQRVYRHGGGDFGEELSLRIVREALDRLEPGGTLLLYTGAAVVDGHDVFLRAVTPLLEKAGARFAYEEIDPDVFGEELEQPPYDMVDRIAAVFLTATRAG